MTTSDSKNNTFSYKGTTLVLSDDYLKIFKLDVNKSQNNFSGDNSTPTWRIWLFDEETKKLNTYSEPSCKQYWQDPFVMGNNSVSSLESSFVSKDWNRDTGTLQLNYSHNCCDVSIFFQLESTGVIWWGKFTNKCDMPVYRFETIADWKISYNDQNSFLLPEYAMPAIEYKPVYKTEYTMHCTWDGFIITSPQDLTALYAIQDENRLMPTHTQLEGEGHDTGDLALNFYTICFRKQGESLVSVKSKLAPFNNLRQWADAYVYDNHCKIKKLKEKVDSKIYDKLASAVMVPIAGNMKEAADFIEEIPGTAMIHTPGYMSPTTESPISWDSFPNYFPPNKLYGSSEDYQNLVSKIHDCGHLFMPRNSFFYWTKNSDIDKKYSVENLAIVRIDGKKRTANWCIPGYLVSPSSTAVLKLLEEFYDKWIKMGTDVYFTNVVAAIDPCGNGYDFHPDCPAPDLLFSQLKRLMKKYGSRVPMLSEGGASWQLPLQTGHCHHPAWNPESPGPDYWRTPDRGRYVKYRSEVGVFLKNEYIRFYPHNTGCRLGQNTMSQLTYSILHSVNPKLGISSKDRFTQKNKRWLKVLSHLGQTVFHRLFGARLLKYEENKTGQIFAEYENTKIIGNFSEQDFDCSNILPECQIATNGFVFMSSDLIAGNFSVFKGSKCPEGEIIIIENNTESRYNTLPQDDSICHTEPEVCYNNSELAVKLRVKMNSFPQYGTSRGVIPLITPKGNTGSNTLEILYNMHYGTIQFLQQYPNYLNCDLTAYNLELIPEKPYDIIILAGEKPKLIINGKIFDKPLWYYVHEQVPLEKAPEKISKWKFCKEGIIWKPTDDKDFKVELIDVI